jgi:anti-sigma regulatory factor (Ser/Thr protein kinase)
VPNVAAQGRFRHEAFFYQDTEAFFDGTTPFIRSGIDAGEPTLVILSSAKIDGLRTRLGADSELVHFCDMSEIGGNPARIIPEWVDFLREHALQGRRLRGIGEPVWAERTASEMRECQVHERLLNVAFANGPAWWLLCPYDATALNEDVIAEALRSHPYQMTLGVSHESHQYSDVGQSAALSHSPLPEPPEVLSHLSFDPASLPALRRLVLSWALDSGFGFTRAQEGVTAVNEVATNSLVHAGGRGRLRVWREGDSLVFEISDEGHIEEPLAGRIPPDDQGSRGRGIWMANQLCDLVQVMSCSNGTIVRLHLCRH